MIWILSWLALTPGSSSAWHPDTGQRVGACWWEKSRLLVCARLEAAGSGKLWIRLLGLPNWGKKFVVLKPPSGGASWKLWPTAVVIRPQPRKSPAGAQMITGRVSWRSCSFFSDISSFPQDIPINFSCLLARTCFFLWCLDTHREEYTRADFKQEAG